MHAMIWPAVVLPPRPGRRIGYVMCMQPVAWPEPDPQIAAAIAAKYRGKRPRPLAVQIRDRLGQWVEDKAFAAAFGTRGRPGWFPSRLEQVVLDALLEKLAAGGLVRAGGKQRTDSTHVIAAVAGLNRLELVGESVRAALEALAAACPDWLEQRVC